MESHCFTKLETHAKIELTWSLSVPRGLPTRLDRAALRALALLRRRSTFRCTCTRNTQKDR